MGVEVSRNTFANSQICKLVFLLGGWQITGPGLYAVRVEDVQGVQGVQSMQQANQAKTGAQEKPIKTVFNAASRDILAARR